ncbi:hypothetical protein BC835DRAFT_1416606 [Cytidiella melzeri]|nr:hypothetical protein BC835DRAFT_1416606 [Cytidiella melzeri]
MVSPDPAHSTILPYDILAEIIAWFVAIFRPPESWRSRRSTLEDPECFGYVLPARRNKYLRDVSLVSRALNNICGKYIFATYVLTFRATYCRDPSAALFPEDEATENGGYSKWNSAANPLRISHMASKSSFIRELYIRDDGTNDLPPLPDSVIPDLCSALKSLKRVRIIRFHCYGEPNVLHASLWDILRGLDLKTIDIKTLLPPQNVEPLPAIEDVAYDWTAESTEYEKLFNPSSLHIRCQQWREHGDKFPPLFKPTSKKLLHFKAHYFLRYTSRFRRLLFDLTEVPHASVDVAFATDCNYKFHIPQVWCQLKRAAIHSFAEGLDRYSTSRSEELILTASRPAIAMPDIPDLDPSTIDVRPDFQPGWQVHLEGPEAEREEAEQMMEYYASRRRF